MKKRIVALAVVAALAVLTGSVLLASATAATSVTPAKNVTVNMTDFNFKIITAGHPIKHGIVVTFKVVNKGAALHNFDIQRVKASKLIGPGKTTFIKVTFKKAGRYPYLCDVPRHAELGMAGTLVVK
jgi:plastocyanin